MGTIIWGALWLIGGLVVTVWSYNAAYGGGEFLLAWGPVVYGGWTILSGIFQMATGSAGDAGESEAPRQLTEQEKAGFGLQIILRGMLYLAKMDGGFTPARTGLLQAAMQRLMGQPLPEHYFEKWRVDMDVNGASFLEEVRTSRHLILEEDRRQAVRVAALFAAADGALSDTARGHITQLAKALQAGDGILKDAIAATATPAAARAATG